MAKAYECDMCGKLVKEADSSKRVECGIDIVKDNQTTNVLLSMEYFLKSYASDSYLVELCNDCQIKVLSDALAILNEKRHNFDILENN